MKDINIAIAEILVEMKNKTIFDRRVPRRLATLAKKYKVGLEVEFDGVTVKNIVQSKDHKWILNNAGYEMTKVKACVATLQSGNAGINSPIYKGFNLGCRKLPISTPKFFPTF